MERGSVAMSSVPQAIIVGCGYVGSRLAARWPGPVAGTTARAESAAALGARGLRASQWNLDADTACPLTAADVAGCVLFYLSPPPGSGHGDPRLERALAALPAVPARVVYVSTTAVYGDTGGQRVDESADTAPTNERGARRVQAERTLQRWARIDAVPWVILRVPGIYGPGRLPLERLTRGEPLVRESEAAPGNRIHVDDLVTALLTVATHPDARDQVYNVTDGDPVSRTTFFTEVARQAGLVAPVPVSLAEARERLTPLQWSFLADAREVDGSRLPRRLGIRWAYASHRDGIAASLAAERGAGTDRLRQPG